MQSHIKLLISLPNFYQHCSNLVNYTFVLMNNNKNDCNNYCKNITANHRLTCWARRSEADQLIRRGRKLLHLPPPIRHPASLTPPTVCHPIAVGAECQRPMGDVRAICPPAPRWAPARVEHALNLGRHCIA